MTRAHHLLAFCGVLSGCLLVFTACGDDTGGGEGDEDGSSDSGSSATGDAPRCLDDGSECSKCFATNCCVGIDSCANDQDCLGATLCVAKCDGTFATCSAQCAVSGNAAWDAYASCGNTNCADIVCTFK